ncbi:hypothetical protein [Sphingomonas sp. OTU376]|uniref:hypothetical protein n=1 Tax=Sphingomonas sp. OTU376 TaxID=3043863 RepID=UPI00313DE8B5
MTPDNVRTLLHNRGTRLNPGASNDDISSLKLRAKTVIDERIVNYYRSFNGFKEDFDNDSFISLWPIEGIISEKPLLVEGKLLLPFADFSFSSDVYYGYFGDGECKIWSSLGKIFTQTSLLQFFSDFASGKFDDGLGIALA